MSKRLTAEQLRALLGLSTPSPIPTAPGLKYGPKIPLGHGR